jgi:hypothetical protein
VDSEKGDYFMTFEEKADLIMKSIELEKVGKAEEADTLMRQIPMPAYLAKAFKETVGADFLLENGYNLSEAEAEYGANWLQ